MSSQNPSNPGRRRIAGDRRQRTAQPVPTDGGQAFPEQVEGPADSPKVKPVKAPTNDEQVQSSGVPGLALVVLALATAVAVGLAAYFWVQASEAAATAEAQTRAPAVAEQAAQAVLSYNFETLEADKDKASRFLTDAYGSDYVETFALVEENAPALKADVQARVVASSVMLPGKDSGPDHQRVLLFVDQTTTSTANNGEPTTALNRVTLDMLKVDGTWLVDEITSY